MARKRTLSDITIPTNEVLQPKTAKKKTKRSILEDRYDGRVIPKADENVRFKDLTHEGLMRFYQEAKVNEYVKAEGKFIKFQFGEILKQYESNLDDNGENVIIKRLSYAEIKKRSFMNYINLSMRYINYFIEYFDDDDELMQAYYQIMFMLHFKDCNLTVDTFVEYIIAWFTSESLFNKVVRMVEYNVDELVMKKPDKQYDESIQLTFEHLKAIMGVSIFHRFLIPVVSHFYSIRDKELAEAKANNMDLYHQLFAAFIPLFDKHYDISLYGKLYHTATTRISKTENQEIAMWLRRNRFGTTITSFSHNLMREYLTAISQKTVFNQSAIIFLHVCFDNAISRELIQPDKFEMSDMQMEASDGVNERISRWDRWQIDRTQIQHSEKSRLRSHVAIQDNINRIGEEYGLHFNRLHKDVELQEEYEYYRNTISHPLNDTQMYIIQLYFANMMRNTDDIKMLEIHDMIKLIMIMKRDLSKRNFSYIPFFISSSLKIVDSKKCTKKTVEKYFTNHPSYSDWKAMYGDSFEFINMDRIYSELKTLIAVPITVVDYKYVETRDMTMTPSEVAATDEFIRLLCDC